MYLITDIQQYAKQKQSPFFKIMRTDLMFLNNNVVSFLALLWLCFSATFVVSSSSSSSSDVTALLAFKSKADLKNKLWWPIPSSNGSSVSSSFCKWTGVYCSDAKVVRFVIEGMNLGGIFAPHTLSQLDQLRVLSLQNNSLYGPIPDLSGLVNLKALFLSHNYFSASIPPSVSALHRLKTLDLSNNHLTGEIPESFNGLDRLFMLRLESNWLNGSIPVLNQSSLHIFNISNNSLTGPIPVTQTLLRLDPSSFWWNPGLCGEIVHKECREMQHFWGHSSPAPPPPVTLVLGQTSQLHHGNVELSQSAANKKTHRNVALIIGFSSAGFIFLCSLICFAIAATRKKHRRKSSTSKDIVLGESTLTAEVEAVLRIERENYELEEKIKKVQEGMQIAGMGRSGSLVFCAGEPQLFTLEKLMKASAELLGRGTLGTTYKAAIDIDTRLIVCVKRLDAARLAGTGKEAFEEHMESVGCLRHPNLVPLRAYFQAKEERLLVYDFQPNGSLFSLIHCSKSARTKSLHWTSCLKIAEDVAQGLSYIHQAWRLVHGNLKSSNVLLGSDFEACLTDYCLSVLANSVPTGEQQLDFAAYKAPETLNSHDQCHAATSKSDVYSFGILLIELLSGKHPSEHPNVQGSDDLIKWVKSVREEGNGEECNNNKVDMLVEVGIACSMNSPDQRPTMWQVLKMIQEIKEAVVMED
ncbi:OLC1v1016832C1 [Oldenlandia corymbosa var. corymbosa]|uniref:OLC1v1016832C1 n=1 Tax=Oldenlandia corymbosa var. corymbosa TaxID=529605 RepID=A0AAV1E814_OLDCO|nr:OLC1v1016832C1 [Oldenlandia corymbosa var. corymbosa]